MKGLTRAVAMVALAGAQQLLSPLSVRAQVPDPCDPIPIPGLCESPSPPSPEPVLTPEATTPPPEETPPARPAEPPGGQPPAEVSLDPQVPKGAGKSRAKPEGPELPFAVSGPNNSSRLVRILTQVARYGVPLQEAILQVVGPFPVAGLAWWADDWHAPRSGGRLHQGLDIFAPYGTPLVAAADGYVSQKGIGTLAGLYVEVTDASGIQYFYCHLSGWEAGIEVGTPVRLGQVLGFVGNTGNAINTPPHVHFEFQPGGIPHPPKPWVDEWVKLAERRALALLKSVADERELQLLDFRLTRGFDLAGGGAALAADELLLLAGLQPAVSSIEVATKTLGQMAWEIDWGAQADAQLSELVGDYESYLVGEELIGVSPWPFDEAQGHAAVASLADGSD